MDIKLYNVGKVSDNLVANGIAGYNKRIGKYVNFTCSDIALSKKIAGFKPEQRTEQEGKLILSRLKPQDYLVLLDEKGKQFSSRGFAKWISDKMVYGTNQICFVTGGAYGFSDEVYRNAREQISLSKMTFNHQLIRLIFAEQLFRAFTIINNHPYHND